MAGSAAGVALGVVKWTIVGVATIVALLVIGLVAVPPLARSFTDKWGATSAEVAAKLPGDDVFPAKREIATKAITIDAPPDLVYSLVAQMGQHRGGWYGWDWFYNATKSSDFVDGHYSTRVVPELQHLKVGDKIAINDMVAYDVLVAERPKAVVLCVGSVKPAEWAAGSKPETWTANSMAWVMKPLPGNKTRLLLRMRADGTDTGFARWVWNGPMNFGGALFSRKTMVGIKRTAEKLAKSGAH